MPRRTLCLSREVAPAAGGGEGLGAISAPSFAACSIRTSHVASPRAPAERSLAVGSVAGVGATSCSFAACSDGMV